jgi:hypothetical protein
MGKCDNCQRLVLSLSACTHLPTTATTELFTNVCTTFTCAFINTLVSPWMWGNFSVTTVCHETYTAGDIKLMCKHVVSQRDFQTSSVLLLLPPRFSFIQTKVFSTSIRLFLLSPFSLGNIGLEIKKINLQKGYRKGEFYRILIHSYSWDTNMKNSIQHLCCVNTLKTKLTWNIYIYIFSSYRAVNTLRSSYKNWWANAVKRNNRSLFW